jgi:hypothetical protein
MPVNDPRQKVALSAMVAGLFFSFSFVLIGSLYFPFELPQIETPADKLFFVSENLVYAALPLVGGMLAVMLRKFVRPAALEGEMLADGSRLDIHIRFVRDTVYSLLLFMIMLTHLAMHLDGAFLRVIPVLTTWFIFARLYYWAAYLVSPLHRVFGSTATLAPILFFMIWSLFGLGGLL